jgi:hypothetical protein
VTHPRAQQRRKIEGIKGDLAGHADDSGGQA